MNASLDRAVQNLAEQMQSPAQQPRHSSTPKFRRIETPIAPMDLLAWLRAQQAETKTYWSDREDAFTVAGIGAANVVEADSFTDLEGLLDQIQSSLYTHCPHQRYFGGLRFDGNTHGQDRWSDFSAVRFVLPMIEAGRRDDQYYLACNVPSQTNGRMTRPEEYIRLLHAAAEASPDWEPSIPTPITRTDRPDEYEWADGVQRALAAFEAGSMKKVVLARESNLEFAEDLDPIALLQRLVTRTTFSYHFCFQLKPGLAFIGASPERLYKRKRTYLQSEALAGTRRRGTTSEEDEALSQELLSCDKELREHRIVLDRIRQAFHEHCDIVRPEGSPGLLKLRHCQHLWTRVEGVLHEAGHDAGLLRALHPTPAVGGLPTAAAVEFIKNTESFSRGAWAGPIGWVGPDTTEFAVAIRSGLVDGSTLSLWSGAGIVPGSDPAAEWDELEYKMSNFLSIFEEAAAALKSA